MAGKFLEMAGLANVQTVKQAFAALGNRGPGFDTIRLLAASAVVLHHALKLDMDIVKDDYLYHFSHGYTQMGLLAVSVFFCLSGFLVTPGLAKTGNVIEYLSRRFMRIMPLLVFVVVVTAFAVGPLVSHVSAAEYFTSGQTWKYLKNISTSLSLQLPGVVDYDGGDTINGPMWTLRYEWICYFLIGGASLLGFFRHRWLFLAGWVAAILVLVLYYGPQPADERSFPFMLAFLFAYFGSGVLMFLFGDVLRWSAGLMVLALLALLAAWYFQLSYIFAPFLTGYLVVGLGLVRFPWSALLGKVDLSYGVYLAHSVILMVLMNVHPFTSGLLLFAVALPLAYVVALFTWTFIEAPALRYKSRPAQLATRLLGATPLRFMVAEKV